MNKKDARVYLTIASPGIALAWLFWSPLVAFGSATGLAALFAWRVSASGGNADE